jgi:hypothetical protein
MRAGIELKADEDFDYVIEYGKRVEVLLDGEPDFRGKVVGYSHKAFQVTNGDLYIRGIAEVKVL